MADTQPDILEQFQQFLAQQKQKEQEDAQAEDFEIEIWNADGQGVRTRRSHAKTFLQQFGIDLDAEPDDGNSGDKKDGGNDPGPKSGRQSTGRTTNASGTTNVARKYFLPKTTPK